MHEDNASLISSELQLSKSEDKISGLNLYSYIKFNKKKPKQYAFESERIFKVFILV